MSAMKLAFVLSTVLAALLSRSDALETRSAAQRSLQLLGKARSKNSNDADVSAIADLIGSSDTVADAVGQPAAAANSGSDVTDMESLAGLDDDSATPTSAPVPPVAAKQDEAPVPAAPITHASVMAQERAAASLLATVAATSLGRSESSFQKEIDNLESAVLKLARSGTLAPGMQEFVTEVQTILDVKMKQFVRDQFQQNNLSLYYSYQNISACHAFMPYDGNLSTALYRMPLLATGHCSCRAAETHRFDIMKSKWNLANASCLLKDQFCRFKADNDTLQNAIDGQKQCATSAYDPAKDVKKYLEDQYKFYLEQYNIAVYAKQRCDDGTVSCDAATAGAMKAEKDWMDMGVECASAQTNLDEASCTYKKDYNATCGDNGTYGTCYDKKVACFNTALSETSALQTTLIAQMNDILRISCFLGSLNSTSIATDIRNCKDADFSNSSEVIALVFPKMNIPGKKQPQCFPVPEDDWASSTLYKSKWYQACSASATPCKASCCIPSVPGIPEVVR